MEQHKWLASDDPYAMFRLFFQPGSDNCDRIPVSRRKLRLSAVAMCRVSVHMSADPVSLQLLTVTEKIADGEPLTEEDRATPGKRTIRRNGSIEEACAFAALGDPFAAVNLVEVQARKKGDGYRADGKLFADLLRDIVGNPFASISLVKPVVADSVMLDATYGGIYHFPLTEDARRLAHSAYYDRNADGSLVTAILAILADALEESGCDCEELLRSLRGWEVCPYCCGNGFRTHTYGDSSNEMSGATVTQSCDRWRRITHPRYRGQWALDLVLGKE